ncbi:MAG TPA: hypothetical protein VFB62_08265 [Polyangiaceae bacterium]|nr:hypothetical protein [Polyangiaceae bacterium]
MMLLWCACTVSGSDDDDAPSGSGGNDTRFHPEANGTHMSETDACNQLRNAYESKKRALCGVATVPTCPGFLRTQYQPECMQYDQGTVSGCVQYYQGIQICEELIAEDCALVTYPETAPAGCP